MAASSASRNSRYSVASSASAIRAVNLLPMCSKAGRKVCASAACSRPHAATGSVTATCRREEFLLCR